MYRAVKLHIRLFNWERALEVAVRAKAHVDTVLWYRARYLAASRASETLPRFAQVRVALGC